MELNEIKDKTNIFRIGRTLRAVLIILSEVELNDEEKAGVAEFLKEMYPVMTHEVKSLYGCGYGGLARWYADCVHIFLDAEQYPLPMQ